MLRIAFHADIRTYQQYLILTTDNGILGLHIHDSPYSADDLILLDKEQFIKLRNFLNEQYEKEFQTEIEK